jgi:dihydrofolate synthase/folylpolyglutamate synthase
VWPGRLERLNVGGVEWILDVAHNPAGAWALRAGLRDAFKGNQAGTLIFSCLRDKPINEMAQILFPVFDQVIFAPIQSARAAALGDLTASARITGTVAVAAGSVAEALRLANDRADGRAIVISGSVYLVGEARSLLLAESSAHR